MQPTVAAVQRDGSDSDRCGWPAATGYLHDLGWLDLAGARRAGGPVGNRVQLGERRRSNEESALQPLPAGALIGLLGSDDFRFKVRTVPHTPSLLGGAEPATSARSIRVRRGLSTHRRARVLPARASELIIDEFALILQRRRLSSRLSAQVSKVDFLAIRIPLGLRAD
jgi:hypothetical protein